MLQVHYWDMDHTLIDNDCDLSWKTFLLEKGLAPPDALDQADRFYELYQQGKLPIAEFLEFQLTEIKGRTVDEVAAWADEHFSSIVLALLYPEAERRVRRQLTDGRTVVLLTATSRPIALPVPRHLGIADVLATEPEIVDGRYTGRIAGPYCGGAGKIGYIEADCARRGTTIDHAWYYGDSKADIPVLEAVGHPVAVNPAGDLLARAEDGGWPVWRWSLEG